MGLRVLSWCCVFAFGIAVVSADEFRPNLGPDLEQVTVRRGDLTLMLRRKSQWTPGRIDFRGVPMTTEKSAYGTVFSFPGVGFIGTNHLENEPEDLKALVFEIDGKAVAEPGAKLVGKTFRFIRKSRVRGFGLKCEIELRDNRLTETTTVAATEATPLKLVYHFMHAWTPTVSAWLAGSDDAPGESLGGPLLDSGEVTRKFYIERRVDWMAVYEPNSGQFAVSRLLEAPEQGGHVSKIWNVPGTYRKYYLTCFSNETVPAGFTGTWRMVTAFGKSDPGKWEAAASKLATELKEPEK